MLHFLCWQCMGSIPLISTHLYLCKNIFTEACSPKDTLKNRCEDSEINHWNVRKHDTELFPLPPLPLFLLRMTHQVFSFASFRAQGGDCPSWAVDLYFAHSSRLLSCRPAEADGLSMVLINLHPSTSQAMDLSSQHIAEERRSYYLFSRFGEGRRWKKWSPGFAVQIEINPKFFKNFLLCSINPGTRSPGFKCHWEH